MYFLPDWDSSDGGRIVNFFFTVLDLLGKMNSRELAKFIVCKPQQMPDPDANNGDGAAASGRRKNYK